jgi:cobalt-precorrin-7 (C5)-methyltransferase
MSTITVVGIGPGDPDLLTLKARETIQAADVVAAFESVLAPIREWVRGEVRPMRYADQEKVLDELALLAGQSKRCVVCVWGDVSFSARELVDRVRSRVDHVELIPGISSVQVACARMGLAMEQSVFVTLHARDGYQDALQEAGEVLLKGKRNVILLPRPWDLMPAAIAETLIQQGLEAHIEVHVLERLSLPDERMTRFDLASLAASDLDFSDLSIVVFPASSVERPT